MTTNRDRRRSPRLELLNRIHGHITSLDTPVVVREISLGGMSLQTVSVLPVGSMHEFRLTLGDGSTVLLRGRVLRSTRAGTGESTFYISGIQFVDDEAADGASVGGLIDKLS